jgi:hypothetical protein
MRRVAFAAICLALAASAPGQQVPDRNFRPDIGKPRYALGTGPVVCVDEAHHNFHTLDGRFFAFGELLRREGFQLRANAEPFGAASLGKCRVLVISNAQPSDAGWDQYPYPTPSAFTGAEIAAVHRWVSDGGSLLLIADHMPLAGAAKDLAAASTWSSSMDSRSANRSATSLICSAARTTACAITPSCAAARVNP